MHGKQKRQSKQLLKQDAEPDFSGPRATPLFTPSFVEERLN
jgi:hypothetical protein